LTLEEVGADRADSQPGSTYKSSASSTNGVNTAFTRYEILRLARHYRKVYFTKTVEILTRTIDNWSVEVPDRVLRRLEKVRFTYDGSSIVNNRITTGFLQFIHLSRI
jgi:hypothetical protein